MEKPVARLTKIKRVKTRSTDTRNRIESVAADPPTIGKTANEHYELCYACKFEKLDSGHRTGKGQFSFQSQRKSMPKNAQTTAQLHSSHTLVK